MGVVYRAVDEKLDRPVAIKVLPPERMTDPERRRRFRREARTEAALNHPNIAAIYEVDESAGLVFLVMEYIEGQTLREQLAARPLPIPEAVRIGAEIAEGLAYAHDHQVIHRDLKPENVMVRVDGHVKLLDFGLAKLLEEPGRGGASASTASTETAELSAEGQVLGTVDYMSPEQARGQALDRRSDLFSFGVVLYEMVTGRTPFRGETAADTVSGILEREAAPAGTWNPAVPEGLERLLRRCLAKAPAERYDSARDLRADLLALGGETPGRVARRWSRRQVAWGAAGLAGLVLVAALLTWGGARRGMSGETPAYRLAVLPFDSGAEGSDTAYLGDGITERLISNLTRLPQLTVMARSTVDQLRGRDPREVGRELKGAAVLTGRLAPRGDELVVRAELVDARTGERLWGEEYQRGAGEIPVLELDLAREIIDGLRLTLTSEESRRLEKQPTEDAEAYRLYLMGRWYVNRYDPTVAGKGGTGWPPSGPARAPFLPAPR
jgi:TolB-like protein/predicted Ser/Thr protein kinase